MITEEELEECKNFTWLPFAPTGLLKILLVEREQLLAIAEQSQKLLSTYTARNMSRAATKILLIKAIARWKKSK